MPGLLRVLGMLELPGFWGLVSRRERHGPSHADTHGWLRGQHRGHSGQWGYGGRDGWRVFCISALACKRRMAFLQRFAQRVDGDIGSKAIARRQLPQVFIARNHKKERQVTLSSQVFEVAKILRALKNSGFALRPRRRR